MRQAPCRCVANGYNRRDGGGTEKMNAFVVAPGGY